MNEHYDNMIEKLKAVRNMETAEGENLSTSAVGAAIALAYLEKGVRHG